MTENILLDYILEDSFIINNKNLSNLKKFTINITNSENYSHIYDEHINKHLMSNIKSYLFKEVISILEETEETNYIDYIGKNIDDGVLNRYLVEFIKSENYQYIITNSLTSSILQDVSIFNHKLISYNFRRSSDSPYSIGQIFNTKIYTDPYMKYNDNRMIMFNDVFINLQNFKIDNFGASLDYSLKTSNSKVVFIVDSENCESYIKYKKHNRNINLNKILGE